VLNPKEIMNRGYGKAWSVEWEGGPYEWAVKMSLEYDCDTGKNGPYLGVAGVAANDNFNAEPYYSFSLSFWPN